MTLTRYGLREWGSAGVAAIVVIIMAYLLIRHNHTTWGIILAAAAVILWCAFAAFFRNPVRIVPAGKTLIVSPADGTVRDIGVVDCDIPSFKGKALRIGIFLSVLNVHVNRAPAEMLVDAKFYREGEYLDARNPQCGQRNEAMTISGVGLAAGVEFPVAVRQISGAIARRIVCPVEPGRKLAKGELYGMIKFGSRTELYLPAEGFEVKVKVGDAVNGGSSVLAEVVEPEVK